ncbi:MAG: NAD(+)--rifampin ADP-ribosyltransferase [Gemmatimonadaceae bacterium]|nr:NAD(+)--rifampin ADP-ribosyltransferase [Gemmatimonadaceae bacterium]
MTDTWEPVTYDSCVHVSGPFYHGTRATLTVGDLLSTGHPTHFESGRALKHVYFSANLEPAIWGAELAIALSGAAGRGHIYLVAPTGPFEDDPNLTNKRFPGNPTRSYRSRDPLRIVGVVDEWQGHSADVIQGMLDSLESLKRRGLYVIEE